MISRWYCWSRGSVLDNWSVIIQTLIPPVRQVGTSSFSADYPYFRLKLLLVRPVLRQTVLTGVCSDPACSSKQDERVDGVRHHSILFICLQVCWSSTSGSTFRSSGGRSDWPWTRQRHTRQLDIRAADGGFCHFHPPAETEGESGNETSFLDTDPRSVCCAYLVVFEHSQLDLLPLVLVLLWSRVRLLLPLFGATTKSEHQVQGRLLRQKTWKTEV